MNNKRSLISRSPVIIAVIIAAAILLNILISLLPIKYTTFDITSGRTLSLSDETRDFIGTISDDVTICVLDADGSDKSLETILTLYDEYSDHIKVEYMTSSEYQSMLSYSGTSEVSPYTIIIQSDKRSQTLDYSSMFYYYNEQFGAMSQSMFSYYYQILYSYASSDYETYGETFYSFAYDTILFFCGEQMITGCIEYTLLDHIPHAYYLTGHGEEGFDSSELVYNISMMGLMLEELDLSEQSSIPTDANCLILNAPSEDLSKEKATLISDYLSGGGAMIIMTNESNIDMENLMSLVTKYGVAANKGIVAVDYEAEEGEEAPNKYLLAPTINDSHDSLYEMASYGTAMLNCNDIAISDELGKSVLVTKLMTTGNEAYLDGIQDSEGEKTVAVAIEEETSNGTTEIIWFTGADSFNSDNLTTENSYAVAYSMLWCGEDYESALGEISPIDKSEAALTVSSTARLALALILIAVIPLVVLTVGIVKYHKKKKALATLKADK